MLFRSGKTVIYSDSFLIKKDGRRIIIHHDMSKYPYGFCHQAIIYKKKLHDEHGMYVFSKKLIISDTLFFIRIPVEEMMKVDTIIANFAAGGASGNAGYDLQKQNLCAQYIFKNRTFTQIVWGYYFMRLRHLLIPNRLRQIIRQRLGRIEMK